MRIVLILVGLLLGLVFGSGSSALLGTVIGALSGFLLSEIVALRRRAQALEDEVASLRRAARSATSDAPVAARAPASETPRPAAVAAAAEAKEPRKEQPRTDERASTVLRSDFGASGTRASGSASESASRPASANNEPDVITRAITAIREYFTGGNTLVRAGVVILFIGVAFLLRYIAEHTNVPIQLRLAGVALGGIVLLVLGWRLRKKRPGYALALQGGAIGILYLTVFASLRLFTVMSPGPAFLLLVVLSALCAALAVLQNSLAFSVLAVGCGFLAPVLASTGEGNHVVLFSYYCVLNLAIVAIAWFKSWRLLNVVGFLFTFVIGTAWGVLRYQREFLSTTEPFLIVLFLLYVAIAVLFSIRQKPALRGYVDGTIVFGVPVVAFALQSGLVRHIPFALAYSAAAVSAMYLALAWILFKGRRETQQLLIEAFMALGIVFLTLAVPLALDGRWSAATWSLEGAALVWIGCRQGRRLARAFGALLQIAGGIIFLFDVDAPYGQVPILNSAYLGAVMIAFGSVFAARALRRTHYELHEAERFYAPVLFVWGLLWWLGGGIAEIVRHLDPLRLEPYVPAAIMALFALTALICQELRRRFDLVGARSACLMLLPVMILYAGVLALVALFENTHPFAHGGWASWPFAFAAFYYVCRKQEPSSGWVANTLHVLSAWLLVIILTWEFAWMVDSAVAGSGSWPAIAWAVIPGVALFMLPKLRARLRWPVGAHEEAYLGIAGPGIAVAVIFWSLATNLSMRGDPFPLPYVPLLNPLDLAQAFVLLVLVRYWLAIRNSGYRILQYTTWKPAAALLAVVAFVWLNAVLLRTLHHYAGVPFDLERMLESTLVHTSLSIFWTVLAIATMLVGTRFGSRIVWITGASLLVVVVVKLFVVDLRVEALGRIVSLVVVGLLMLLVGYLSPLPPARKEEA